MRIAGVARVLGAAALATILASGISLGDGAPSDPGAGADDAASPAGAERTAAADAGAGTSSQGPAAGEAGTPASAPEDEGQASQQGQPVPVPEPSEQAIRYYRGGIGLWLFGIAWGIAVPAFFLFTRLSARIRDVARKIGRNWYFTIVVYDVIFTALTFVIDLPLSYYEGFAREHAYGLSEQTLGKWAGDSVKALILGCIVGALFLWIPYLLLKKSPRRWWLYTWLATIPFIVLMILVQPVWIDPIFNDFGPMKDKALEARILDLADRAGIEGGRVYEVDKSEDTKKLNAYVTGFMSTKRIVLWDTTIAKLTPDEVLFVMGHEMGHYVLGHIWKAILFISVLILAILYAAHRLSSSLIERFKHRWGFDSLSDIASLPLILLLVAVLSLAVAPAVNGFSRWQERQSDRFGLEITQNNAAAATAFVKLMTEGLGVPRPHPLVVIWRGTHPPLGERIDFCNTYRPWETGRPLRYGHHFKTKAARP